MFTLLSHKELLGTWIENSSCFVPGQTVPGCIRSVEDYGIFVELTPNLSGLAEVGSFGNIQKGTGVSVYIKNIVPEKMKIKLSIVDVFDEPVLPPEKYEYFFTGNHIDSFSYGGSLTGKQSAAISKKV